MKHSIILPPINNSNIYQDQNANTLVEGIPSIVYVSPEEIDA